MPESPLHVDTWQHICLISAWMGTAQLILRYSPLVFQSLQWWMDSSASTETPRPTPSPSRPPIHLAGAFFCLADARPLPFNSHGSSSSSQQSALLGRRLLLHTAPTLSSSAAMQSNSGASQAVSAEGAASASAGNGKAKADLSWTVDKSEGTSDRPGGAPPGAPDFSQQWEQLEQHVQQEPGQQTPQQGEQQQPDGVNSPPADTANQQLPASDAGSQESAPVLPRLLRTAPILGSGAAMQSGSGPSKAISISGAASASAGDGKAKADLAWTVDRSEGTSDHPGGAPPDAPDFSQHWAGMEQRAQQGAGQQTPQQGEAQSADDVASPPADTANQQLPAEGGSSP